MCEDCSDFVSFELAERLINPATISKFNQSNGKSEIAGYNQLIISKIFRYIFILHFFSDAPKTSPNKSKAQAKKDELITNFLDFAGFGEDQRSFRSCKLCKEVLDKRDQR